ncbi:Phosphoethanolamine transferase EptA [Pseudomonas fluorescens]|uniref:Phosphoethanolamine transferase EptA n=1 Tax=Pseudomonas fluorescens TaxID=294 RepID=A0A5E6PI03_PSEFL|nr:phosphoethanolamine--lipid A transferase [Pseudomonas fluorescens]VVM42696.1 Phosphoethanolamine transferase EptA [Pseudomonas fluorescens]
MLRIRPVRPEFVSLLASAFLLLAFNSVLWQHLGTMTQALHLRGAFAVILYGVFFITMTLLSFPYLQKVMLVGLCLVSSLVAYFMSQYGVMIDAGMFRNVTETNVTEVRDLLSPGLLWHIALLGVLPSLILFKAPVAYRTWPRELAARLALVCIAAVLVGVVAWSNYQGLASLFRNHHELRLMVVPSNIIGATAGYLREQVASAREPFAKVGDDAHRSPAALAHRRPSLTVLVVGESARADNFGVLGYGRDTTPQLARQAGVIAFPNVHSCGTETAVSVPCMFSNLGRKDYNASKVQNREGLLDVLVRAGVDVHWRDNQSGCKGVCDRVGIEDVSKATDPALCAHSECRDEILLLGLDAYIDNLQRDTVLVLHQMGSHGPEYFKRYPKAFERFTPVCQSNALNDCSQDSIVNAYDNTIVYTDHVLSSLIDVLRRHQNKVDTAMVYLSDHGESLGEFNLYLHGTPYLFAPEQQKHIGMLAWFSAGYEQDVGLNSHCLELARTQPLSQDNLFHSILGLLDVQTGVYQPDLDMFASCRSPQV